MHQKILYALVSVNKVPIFEIGPLLRHTYPIAGPSHFQTFIYQDRKPKFCMHIVDKNRRRQYFKVSVVTLIEYQNPSRM